MENITPDPKKRGYLLPLGCKNISDVLPRAPKRSSPTMPVRVNGKILASEVRVIGERGEQLGVMLRGDALNLARSRGLDLVEIEPTAKPPICRIVNLGKFLYETGKNPEHAG